MNNLKLLKLLQAFALGVIFLLLTILKGCSPEPPSKSMPPRVKLSIPKANEPPVDMDLLSGKTQKVYQYYCAQCHGVRGHGDGVNAPYLVVPPRDHTKADYLETRSDQQLFEAIKLGGLAVGRAPCMPAWGHTFDDKTIQSLVNYIRDLCNCGSL